MPCLVARLQQQLPAFPLKHLSARAEAKESSLEWRGVVEAGWNSRKRSLTQEVNGSCSEAGRAEGKLIKATNHKKECSVLYFGE